MIDPLGGLADRPEPEPERAPEPRRPPATSTAVLLALMIAGFIAEGALSGWKSFEDDQALLRLGAIFGPAIADGDWWRIGSYAFLHIGWAHLIVNGASLVSLMRWIEAAFGSANALGLFSASAIAGGALSAAVRIASQDAGLAAGASAGIFGLLGAWIALWIRLRKRVPREVFRAQLRAFFLTLVINAAIAFTLPVDNFAHSGGLVAGFLMGLLAPLPIEERKPHHALAQAALLLSALALAAAEGAAIARAVHPAERRLQGAGVEAKLPWNVAPVDRGHALTLASLGIEVMIGRWNGPEETAGDPEVLGGRKFHLRQGPPDIENLRACKEVTSAISQEDGDGLYALCCCVRNACLGPPGRELCRSVAATLRPIQ